MRRRIIAGRRRIAGMVTDLRAGDFVPFQARPRRSRSTTHSFADSVTAMGRATRAGARAFDSAEKRDQRHLPLFRRFGHSFVSYPPSYSGDPLVVFTVA
jgi:hypothetical protein